MSAYTWPGETAALEGLVFGQLVVEAPGRVDERGVRVICRCSCGRVAVRLVAELRTATRCRACAESDAPARSGEPKAIAARSRRARRMRETPIVRSCPGCGSTWCAVPLAMGRMLMWCSRECRIASTRRPDRRVHHCGVCSEPGHYATTCPRRHER